MYAVVLLVQISFLHNKQSTRLFSAVQFCAIFGVVHPIKKPHCDIVIISPSSPLNEISNF